MAFLVAQFCATKQRFGITGERSERMIVTHKIKMDLTQWGPPPCIDVVQDDKYSRNIQISLFEMVFLIPCQKGAVYKSGITKRMA